MMFAYIAKVGTYYASRPIVNSVGQWITYFHLVIFAFVIGLLEAEIFLY
jgi:hypothetical protein